MVGFLRIGSVNPNITLPLRSTLIVSPCLSLTRRQCAPALVSFGTGIHLDGRSAENMSGSLIG